MNGIANSTLEDAIRDRYVLDRELGAGGMATVYLARDLRHERPVALKLLRPELGAILGAERFLREIRLTANLQHPHILPLLDSGEAGGQFFYVMPFVEGESLRDRLHRDGQLPLDDTLRLAREVADALGYAHQQGIIHRDIKPENILLSRGHALVADFGIALAVTQAGGGRLTETGLSLGTPAYMSPEQALAEPKLDGRTDQYSLACVVYEMLAGEPPYTGPTAQAIISKRLSAPVPSIRHSHPGIPEALDQAVRRAMALAPADRFPSVAGFADALSAETDAGRPRIATMRRLAWAVLTVVLATTLLVAGNRWLTKPARARSLLDANLVVVAPLENRTGDPALDPFGLMAADWVTQQLTGTDIIRVVDAQSMLLAAHRADRGASGGRLRMLAEETGAGTAVVGSYYRDGDSLRVQVRVIDARSGSVRTALPTITGPLGRPTAVLDALRARVTGGLAALLDERLTTWKVASTTPPGFDAYREFLLAMQFHMRYDEEQAVPHFERAAALDSTFWQAHLWTGMEYGNLGHEDRMDSVFQRLERNRAWLSPYDQANLDYFNRSFVAGRWDEGHDAALRMARLAPDAGHPLYAIARTALALNRPREAIDAMMRMDRTRGWGQAATYTYPFLVAAFHLVGDEAGQRRAALLAPEAVCLRCGEMTAGVLPSKAGGAVLTGLGNAADLLRRLDSLAREWNGVGASPGVIGRAAAAEARFHGHAAAADSILVWATRWFESHGPSDSRDPGSALLSQRALMLGEAGRATEGLRLAEAAVRAAPASFDRLAALGILQARTGHADEARRTSQRIGSAAGRDWFGRRRYRQACIAARLGDAETALRLLEEARGLGLELWTLHADPNVEPLWRDQRFQNLVRPES